MRHTSSIALLLPMLALSGCAVGTVHVIAPERLPPKSLPPLMQRVSFDVCIPPRTWSRTPAQIERERRALGDRVSGSLSRAGVSADLTAASGSPALFTVTELPTEHDHAWSTFVSMFTLSVIPGYSVDRRTLDVNLAWRDPAQAERREHLQYESRIRTFVWAPLVVYPDFFFSINGGWESSESKDAGFERTIARLADDIRDRLGRDGAGAPGGGEVGVTCPPLPPMSSGRPNRDPETRPRG